ncbi:MAG: AbrB/MazE/SpoVT family DNA-binding domain-containing protein [Desulfurococcales archaeon]|nr:AbrB/MazE/SpoVT family DNA-binding domain-containing protein [Desulfurococcales archaeon]
MAIAQGEAELRRVQRLGGSSLVVTIPKHWAKRLNIRPGDEVAVIDEGEVLKIVPASRDNGKGSLVLRVRVNNVILSFGVERIVYCAYALGYAGVSFEWNPRSIKLDPGDIVATLESNPLVHDVVEARQGRVVAAFKLDETAYSLHVRALGALLLSMLAAGGNAESDEKIEALIASILRGRSRSCISSAPLLASIADILFEIMNSEGRDRPEIQPLLGKLSRIAVEVSGGASVGSIKRLSNALKELEELKKEASRGDTRLHGIVEALIIVLKRLAVLAACESLNSSDH